MCPACISTVTLIVAGVISTGGLAMLTRLKFRAVTGAGVDQTTKHQNNEAANKKPGTAEPQRKGSKMEPRIVTQTEWLAARKQHLLKEKEFTRLRDELSQQRRELPWEKVQKQYVFDGPGGKETLADLFGGCSQLIIYHFMFGPDWAEGCPSCSLLADHFDGSTVHLAQRDVTLMAVSRAPLPQIEAFKKRMGWRFKWVSSYGNDFNHDYHVSFSKEEMASGKAYYNYEAAGFPSEEGPGASVFFKRDGEIFHTYSSYGRGLDMMIGAYNFLDITPKGRDEQGLAFSMAWVRHHDRYAEGYAVDPTPQYQEPKAAGATCCSQEEHA